MTSSDTTTDDAPVLPNKAYGFLKWTSAVGLPALGTATAAIGGIWHVADTQQIVLTIAAVNTFCGAALGVSAYTYKKSSAKYDGVMAVKAETGEPVQPLTFRRPVSSLKTDEAVYLKIQRIE